MAEIEQEEKQQELFLQFSGETKRPERFPALAKTHKPILLNTTVEQIILVSIAVILVGCFVFFLGVLRGRSLSARPSHASAQAKIPVATIAPQKTAANPSLAAKPEVRVMTINNNKVESVQNVNKPYTIQISRYKKQDLAEKEAVALRRSGFYSTIDQKSGYYEVCVGQYATRDAAKKDLKIFSAKYKGCFLRRRS